MLLSIVACEDLEQAPSNIATSDSLTDFEGVLFAAYYYQHGSATPLAVMGDFRADNALMFEEPYPSFDRFDGDLVDMEDQFFGPFYTALYKSILSANNVIENSDDPIQVGEAQFLRGLSYFKLVKVFGDVPVNLSAEPSTTDLTILERQPVDDVYNNVIIPDLEAAIEALDILIPEDGRASKYAAQGMLGKVYLQRGDFTNALPHLAAVVEGAEVAGIELLPSFSSIFGEENDLNAEIIFATQFNSSIEDEYGFTEFSGWFSGGDTKALEPLDSDLIAAFAASTGDRRTSNTIDATSLTGVKWGLEADQDWIELRFGDVILMYAEALNETGNTSEALTQLNRIRSRAGIENSTADSQATLRSAILDERRLELAFEGQRWFDLVRTGTVNAEMDQETEIDSDYYLFPIPVSEILATNGVITQNPGY